MNTRGRILSGLLALTTGFGTGCATTSHSAESTQSARLGCELVSPSQIDMDNIKSIKPEKISQPDGTVITQFHVKACGNSYLVKPEDKLYGQIKTIYLITKFYNANHR